MFCSQENGTLDKSVLEERIVDSKENINNPRDNTRKNIVLAYVSEGEIYCQLAKHSTLILRVLWLFTLSPLFKKLPYFLVF